MVAVSLKKKDISYTKEKILGKIETINEGNKQFYKGDKNVNKLVAQNNVLNLYSDVLQSPHTYDNMMTSIDSSFFKE